MGLGSSDAHAPTVRGRPPHGATNRAKVDPKAAETCHDRTMQITMVLSAEEGPAHDLGFRLTAERTPSVGDYVTVGTRHRLTLQVVELDWSQDLTSVTLHLRDPNVSGPLTREERRQALTDAGWTREQSRPAIVVSGL